MIISGGSRSNWRFFSKHLTNAKDNERVGLIEIRGLASNNVLGAFREMDAVASGTRCKNFFYHADINPREDERLTPQQWEVAVDTLEKNLGLEGHSRLVVEHEKEGRIHRHVIWSRIDPDSMTAVSDSHDFKKHQLTSRMLEQEFGHEAVRGAHEKDGKGKQTERRPKNWETFRGNKSGVDAEQVKAEVTMLWQESDNGASFRAALQERGYLLCKGDRRDFCIVDPAGNEHSLARRIAGVKAADIRARLADVDRDSLPTVAKGKERNTGGGLGDTEAHRRLRRVQLDKELQPYLRERENPDADETAKEARRSERVKQRRERRANLLHLEKQVAQGRNLAKSAHVPSIKDEMQPYTRASRQGRELQPASAFFSRASEFMRQTARESGEAVRKWAGGVKDSWTRYLESRSKRKESEPDRDR